MHLIAPELVENHHMFMLSDAVMSVYSWVQDPKSTKLLIYKLEHDYPVE